MKLLLDTHILLWWLDDVLQITEATRSIVRDPVNAVYVSAVSAWEIVIKKALGKLDAPEDLGEVIRACQFSSLPITIEHALAVRDLPLHHHDPFDRMLVAQAKVEGLTIVTCDSNILRYSVSHLPA